MKRVLFALVLSACGSLAAETSQNEVGTETHSAGTPVESPTAGSPSTSTERANCADWNTHEFFKLAVPEDISSCLSEGADPNATDNDGSAPLRKAVGIIATDPSTKTNQAAVVQALIAEGADPNAKLDGGWTILGRALNASQYPPGANLAVIQALVAAGADPNALIGIGLIATVDHADMRGLGTTGLHCVAELAFL